MHYLAGTFVFYAIGRSNIDRCSVLIDEIGSYCLAESQVAAIGPRWLTLITRGFVSGIDSIIGSPTCRQSVSRL